MLKWLGHLLLGSPTKAELRDVDRQGVPNNESRLNQLETRVERLELDHAERQIAVMQAMEKVLHQLRARERKREREAADDTSAESDTAVAGVAAASDGFPRPAPAPSTAHLALRFRR